MGCEPLRPDQAADLLRRLDASFTDPFAALDDFISDARQGDPRGGEAAAAALEVLRADERACEPVHRLLIREAFGTGFTYGCGTADLGDDEEGWDQAEQAAFGIWESDPGNMSQNMRMALHLYAVDDRLRSDMAEVLRGCITHAIETGSDFVRPQMTLSEAQDIIDAISPTPNSISRGHDDGR